ncbi:MAG: flagellar hook-length control protein FliK [Lachnospiraceae bacterium]|nr:flagellar hook-length control protein FliK [Lachnospiraceae bacterium]
MISTNIVQTGLISGAENVSLSTGSAEDINVSSVDFSSFMNNSGNTGNSPASGQPTTVIDGNVQTMPSNSEKINVLFTAKNQNISNEIVDEDMIVNMDTLMTVDTAAMQLIQQVMEIIQSDTGCSKEELVNTMNNIGAKPSDLLSSDTVKNIVLELNGLSRPQELLTNQEAYMQFVDIMEQVKPLVDDFTSVYEFTPEQNSDISETIKQFIVQEKDVSDMPPEMQPADEQTTDIKPEGAQTKEIQSDETVENNETDATWQKMTLSDHEGNADENIQNIENNKYNQYTANIPNEKNAEVVDVEKTEYESKQNVESVPKEIMEEVMSKPENRNDVPKDTTKNQNEYVITDESADNSKDVLISYKTQNKSEMSQNNNSSFGGNRQNADVKQNAAGKTIEVHTEDRKNVNNADFTAISNNLFEHIKESVSDVHTTETSQTSFATRIFNQVMEGIKVISGEDMSSMEMQLQPENLGKLNIQVVSKNGIITAQIITQSEAVKQAIESQMFLLKENMNNQEITIEDVEVTVSSHAFEQGMDNGSHENSNQQQKRRKFVSEDDMQAVNAADIKAIKEEILEEAMKEHNGSTVSYTA